MFVYLQRDNNLAKTVRLYSKRLIQPALLKYQRCFNKKYKERERERAVFSSYR